MSTLLSILLIAMAVMVTLAVVFFVLFIFLGPKILNVMMEQMDKAFKGRK